MKNWSIKMLVAMLVSVAACVLLTALCRMLHIQFWSMPVAIVVSFLISCGIVVYMKAVENNLLIGLIAAIPVAVCFLANQWLFYSSNETVHFANVNELVNAKEKPLYFTLDQYYWNYDAAGVVEITTERKRHGRTTSTSQDIYIAIPLYPDSISEKINVWLVDNYPKSTYDAAEDYESLLKYDDIINFELLTEDLEDYETAVGYSSSKDKAENAIFITPLYKEYIPRTTWGIYFLIGLVTGGAIMALIGFIISKRKEVDSVETE